MFMDKDKNYIPPGRTSGSGGSGYGRKVSRSSYDMDRARDELNRKRSSEKKKRDEERQRNKKRRHAARIRFGLATTVVFIIAFIVLFLSPMLDIKNIAVSGNSIVSSEEVLAKLNGIYGKNLITLSSGTVRESLTELSYVEDVSLSKYLIPPSVRVNITECKPAAKIELNGLKVIVDPQLKILSDLDNFEDDGLPRLEGISVSKYRVGNRLTLADDDEEKLEILETYLDCMSKLKIIDRVDYIDVSDKTNLRFGYDNRIDALCGSRLDLERKIRMFNAAVNGSTLADNAHGIIDLSISGKAVFTP